MSTTTDGISWESLGLASAGTGTASNTNELGQQDFLQLMTTQLMNQDPFQPMENGQFMGQIAQFSQVTGLQDLQKSVSQLAESLTSNEALQASTLVGHAVLAESEYGVLGSDGYMVGGVDVGSYSSNVAVSIYDGAGALVNRIELGAQPPGFLKYTWDGTTSGGAAAPAGTYLVQAESTSNGSTIAEPTYVGTVVDSVTLSSTQGTQINLAGAGTVSLSQVKEIY